MNTFFFLEGVKSESLEGSKHCLLVQVCCIKTDVSSGILEFWNFWGEIGILDSASQN